MLSEPEWERARQAFGLTPRELQVVQALFDTGHRPYIAATLGISENTVGTHLGRAFRKIGVEDRGDVILTVLNRVRRATSGRPRDDSAPP